MVLGSRAVDAFRGVARLSFEKTVDLGRRQQLRAPTYEFSRDSLRISCDSGLSKGADPIFFGVFLSDSSNQDHNNS